ncbi:hypothetical protein MKX01_021030 [Papaver californicum]|nr:hypothetical protein MKX01_021030 [Papaver californicum]
MEPTESWTDSLVERQQQRFFNQESTKICRHETALDAHGRRLIVTSDSVRSPIYQVQGHMSGFRTLPHTGAITTVDWHPTLPIFLTGSSHVDTLVVSHYWFESGIQFESRRYFKNFYGFIYRMLSG